MKAIVFDQFGGPDVLHEADIEVPQPGPGQVRVRVKAAGLNALDGKIRAGMLEAVRPTTLPAVPGGELAGVVDALGEGVSDVQVGAGLVGHRLVRPVRAGHHRGPQARRPRLAARGRAAGGQ